MGWFQRLKQGLSKSSSQITHGIGGIFTKRKLDAAMLEELEDLLIAADLGSETAARLVAAFGKHRFGKEISPEEVRDALATDIAAILKPIAVPLALENSKQPCVILVVGVNGNGKTTTLGKLALQFTKQGKTVLLAACDTFRAAAVEQLAVWAERAEAGLARGSPQADPASVAYAAMEQAKMQNSDILMIDTAGRLQNKTGLMEELVKITRVLKKFDETAPHYCLLILDGTTGQNAHRQVEIFKEMVNVTGLIVTKLDGTAKGGVVVALADRFKLPIHAIGVGEAIEDLHPFSADSFARGLMGL